MKSGPYALGLHHLARSYEVGPSTEASSDRCSETQEFVEERQSRRPPDRELEAPASVALVQHFRGSIRSGPRGV